MKDIYIQNWKETITNSSKLRVYRQYKPLYTQAKYLEVLTVTKLRHTVASFRCSCQSFEIEKVQHANISRSDRLRKMSKEDVEDEYHFSTRM